MNIRTRKLMAALSLYLGAGSFFAVVAQTAAQTAPPASTATAPAPAARQDQPIELEQMVVTGTLIPFAAGAPALPVTVVDSSEIDRTGITTDLVDVLRRSQPHFYGANNLGSDVANINSGDTNGGSGLSLRNRSTLVLINGRRAALSPVLATGGMSFVDVSAIPMSAIERVEILSDGASATYGSDAVSGVVNIILKSNYQGAEIGGSYGFSTNEGHWENRNAFAVVGSSAGDTSLTITAEWKRSDPLIQYERPYSRELFRTPSFAGSINLAGTTQFFYLNPGLNAPGMNLDLTPEQAVAQNIYQGPLTQDEVSQFLDLSAYPTLLAGAERRSFTTAVEHELTPSMRLFGDFIYSLNETESVLNAQPVSGNVAANSPINPFNVAVTARNRFLDFPRIYANESTSLRAVGGVRGNFAEDWSYEAAVNWNRTNHHFRNFNLIDSAVYTELTNSGAYNPFARRQDPGIVESMLGTQVRDYMSALRSFDARVNGPVFELPAGAVMLGAGAAYTWEELDFTNDRFDQTGGWLQATPRQPFNAKMNIDSYYAEARIPLISERNTVPGAYLLEATVAGRHDIYSTTEDPTVPKYTLRWMPFNDELAFRGTYSESFVAPTLYDLFGPVSVGFTSSINITRFDASGNSMGVTSGNRQYRSQTGSNPDLKPSRSRNWTAGVVWSPKAVPGFSVSADWFNIDERDLIASIPTTLIVNDVEQRGPQSVYANLVRFGPSVAGETHFADGTPVSAPGQMTNRPSDEVWISNTNVNVAGAWQSGVDLQMNYRHDSGDLGTFTTTVAGTYLHEYVFQALSSVPAVGYQDGFFARGTGSGREGVFPRYRLHSRLDWSHRDWTAGVAHTYVPGLDDLTNPTPFRVGNYNAFDVQVGHSFANWNNRRLQGLQLAVGVNNVFNRFPPRIPSEGNQSHDINAYDPIGRFIYVQARYKF